MFPTLPKIEGDSIETLLFPSCFPRFCGCTSRVSSILPCTQCTEVLPHHPQACCDQIHQELVHSQQSPLPQLGRAHGSSTGNNELFIIIIILFDFQSFTHPWIFLLLYLSICNESPLQPPASCTPYGVCQKSLQVVIFNP